MKKFRCYGEGPFRVAVVHGGPGAPGSVAAIARELSRKCGVLEPLQTEITLEGQVMELHDILMNYADVPVTLIGHSWGAWLVYILAARYPSLVKKIILVGSGPFLKEYAEGIDKTRLARLSSEERKEFEQIGQAFDSANTKEKDKMLHRLDELVSKTDSFEPVLIETEKQDMMPVEGDTNQKVWGEASKMRRTGQLIELAKQISCPVAAIHGSYDPHPAEGVKIPLECVLENFRFYLLDKCGHSPWKERYAMKEFYEILRREIYDGKGE